MKWQAIVAFILITGMYGSIGCDTAPPTSGSEPTEDSTIATSAGNKPASQVSDLEQLAVGQQAPDFRVELLGGEMLRFSDHVQQAKGPTLLLFDRAHW